MTSKRTPGEAIFTPVMRIRRNLRPPRQVQTSLDLLHQGSFASDTPIEVQDRPTSQAAYNRSAARNVYIVLVVWNLAISLKSSPKIWVPVAVIEKIAVHLALTGRCCLDQNTIIDNEDNANVRDLRGLGLLLGGRPRPAFLFTHTRFYRRRSGFV